MKIVFLGEKEKNFLNDTNPFGFDLFIRPLVSSIKDDYKTTGDPLLILQTTSRLVQELENIPKKNNSIEYSKLLSVHSQMLLAIGKDELLLKSALDIICQAIEICLYNNVISEDTNNELVKNTLIFAVILKALGDFDYSIKSMNDLSHLFLNKRGISKIELISLQRQEIMMHQTINGHKKLLEEAPFYKNLKPIEYYSTLKRILEFSMNNDMYKLASRLLPELKSSFNNVRKRLPPLSHVSFVKNLGQFNVNNGDVKLGKNLLDYALIQAQRLNFAGQYKQIDNLLKELELGEKAKLKTFKI
jgi:hypothetical protein